MVAAGQGRDVVLWRMQGLVVGLRRGTPGERGVQLGTRVGRSLPVQAPGAGTAVGVALRIECDSSDLA